MTSSARRLGSTAYPKPWGSPLTEPWCRNDSALDIGEVWFDETPSVPLLVKFLFTSKNLSVQVHPDDAYAFEHENGSRGKTEMWHILRAEPGAKVAIGLRETIARGRLEKAFGTAEMVDLLNWIPVRAGDTYFVEAGTIHAIGEGIVLCEVQQRSDVTYRLYDWESDRELHFQQAMDVSRLVPSSGHISTGLPLKCDYFHTQILKIKGFEACEAPAICVALVGEGMIDGQAFSVGEAWEASGPISIESEGARFLVTSCHA